MFEVLTDTIDLVVIEGLGLMADFYYSFRRKNFADYFKPHLTRILANVKRENAPLNLKQAFARHCGKFFHVMTILDLNMSEARVGMFEYFIMCLGSKVNDDAAAQILKERGDSDFDADIEELQALAVQGHDELFTLAAFNLPCFFKHVNANSHLQPKVGDLGELSRAADDPHKQMLKMALKLCSDAYPAGTRQLLASGLHELFVSKPGHQCLSRLLEMLERLVTRADSEPDLIPALTKSLEKLIKNYLTGFEINAYLQTLTTAQGFDVSIQKTELSEGSKLKLLMEGVDDEFLNVLVPMKDAH